jgi:tetratricopeptide (TPR) repeat protein
MTSRSCDGMAAATHPYKVREMVSRLGARPTRLVVAGAMCCAFLLAGAAALRPWAAEPKGGRTTLDRGVPRAISIDPGNNRFPAILGSVFQYSLLLRDYPAALTYYQSALRSNPLDSASWLHLGKLYQRLDRPQQAHRALRLALELAPSDASILWEATLAYLEQGDRQEVLQTLSRFLAVSEDDNSSTKAFNLARRLASPEEVLQNIVPPEVIPYTRYMNYLLDRNLGEEALSVWRRLKEMPPGIRRGLDPSLQLRVVDLLIAERQFGPAREVWTKLMKAMDPGAASGESNPISNPSFERRDTLGRGFDWKIGSAPGVLCDVDTSVAYSGRQSLRISFEKDQADFSNVSQVVPVHADSTYTLEAHIKTSGLDASHGLTIEVIEPHKGLLAKTEVVAGTRDWTKVGATFRTSAESDAVTLRVHTELASPSSTRPNAVMAWIDNVSLTEVH